MEDQTRIAELDRLFEEVGTYRTSSEYKELLQFIKRFRKIAPFNAMLLHIQKPGSTFVASVYDWEVRFGRRPKPGARPLVILRPFGPVAFVFELNDTEGTPFPEELLEPLQAIGTVTEERLQSFIKSLYFEGIRVEQQDYGATEAGYVSVNETFGQHLTREGKIIFRVPFELVINKNLDPTTKLATIFHELGHIYCGHLSQMVIPKLKYLPQRGGLPNNNREFEAESVCWLLCEREGINNPSAKYLSGYLDNNTHIPAISIDAVLKAVTAIEHLWEGNRTPRKELIVRREKADQQLTLFDYHYS